MFGFDLGVLGWTPELADNLQPGLAPGRVIAAHRAAFDVQTADAVVRTRLPGRLVHEGLDVAVGDWVGLRDGLVRGTGRAQVTGPSAGPSSSASVRARVKTASIIAGVSFPVKVFCWLGW